MKGKRTYRIRIDDEAHLETKVDATISGVRLCLLSAAALVAVIILAGLLVMVTPLRTLLPGYMKEQQRSATQDNLLRLDSLQLVYENNQAYIDNILRIYDTERDVDHDTAYTDTIAAEGEPATDSLMIPSEREQRFVAAMEERERFNLSVLAPLAADGMQFSVVSKSGIFTTDSRQREKASIIIPANDNILAAADGTIIGHYYSPADHGYVIIIQHHRGFTSRYTGTGAPTVNSGQQVQAGQVIAFGPKPDGKGKRSISLMMWHDGLPVIPYDYLRPIESKTIPATPYEAPRGR